MGLRDILEFRRATRYYTKENLDTEQVKDAIRLATLTPTSSNMQLYEMYHVTDRNTLEILTKACLGQEAAKTANQMVVFVTRQDKYKVRAKQILEYEIENIKRNSPEARQPFRIKRMQTYYGKVMPLIYSYCFGLIGLFRKILAFCIGLFRPIVREVSESQVSTTVHQSCGMVAQTFMLAMAEKGYDTCPIGGFDSRIVKKALKLPCKADVGMIVSCGIRDQRGIRGDRVRVPFEEVYKEMK